MQAALDSIVCHTPLNNLGFSRKGSALTFSVAFQALRAGLFEVGWEVLRGVGGVVGGAEHWDRRHQGCWLLERKYNGWHQSQAEGRRNFDPVLVR